MTAEPGPRAERPPVPEAGRFRPSPRLEAHLAIGTLNPASSPNAETVGNQTTVSKETFTAVQAKHDDLRQQDNERQKQTVREGLDTTGMQATKALLAKKRNVTPEAIPDAEVVYAFQMAEWSTAEVKRINNILVACGNDGASANLVAEALFKLEIIKPEDERIPQLYDQATLEGGAFYNLIATGNVYETLADRLTIEEMQALKPFLKDILGDTFRERTPGTTPDVAFNTLIALKHTQEDLKVPAEKDKMKQAAANSTQLPQADREVLNFCFDGWKLAHPDRQTDAQQHAQAPQTDASTAGATNSLPEPTSTPTPEQNRPEREHTKRRLDNDIARLSQRYQEALQSDPALATRIPAAIQQILGNPQIKRSWTNTTSTPHSRFVRTWTSTPDGEGQGAFQQTAQQLALKLLEKNLLEGDRDRQTSLERAFRQATNQSPTDPDHSQLRGKSISLRIGDQDLSLPASDVASLLQGLHQDASLAIGTVEPPRFVEPQQNKDMWGELQNLAREKTLPTEAEVLADLQPALELVQRQHAIETIDIRRPTVVIPDLHARREMLWDILNQPSGVTDAGRVITVYEAAMLGKVNLVFTGDIIHSEERRRWVDDDPANIDYEIDQYGDYVVDANGQRRLTDIGRRRHALIDAGNEAATRDFERKFAEARQRNQPTPVAQLGVGFDLEPATVADTDPRSHALRGLRTIYDNEIQPHQHEMVDRARRGEMRNNLRIMQMVWRLQKATEQYGNVRVILGTHDDVSGQIYSATKFGIAQTSLLRNLLSTNGMGNVLQQWSQYSQALPIMLKQLMPVNGRTFRATHTIPNEAEGVNPAKPLYFNADNIDNRQKQRFVGDRTVDALHTEIDPDVLSLTMHAVVDKTKNNGQAENDVYWFNGHDNMDGYARFTHEGITRIILDDDTNYPYAIFDPTKNPPYQPLVLPEIKGYRE